VDALGNPLRLILTGAQATNITQEPALVNSIKTDAVVADKGYDSDMFIATPGDVWQGAPACASASVIIRG
jgi:transposase